MTNIVSICIDNEIVEKIDIISKQKKISRSKLIQSLLEYFCNNKELINEAL